MAKNKKGKGKVPNSGRAAMKGKAQKRASNFFIQDDDYEEAQRSFRGFSGAQQKYTPTRPENAKYRHLPMSFVSASSPPNVETRKTDTAHATAPPDTTHEDLDSEEDDEEEEDDLDDNIETNILMDVHLNVDMDNMQIDSSNSRTSKRAIDEQLDATTSNQASAVEMEVDNDEPSFVVDTVGDSTLAAGGFHGKLPVRRAASPARSDSSEEVVFSGRSRATVVNDPVTKASTATSRQPARQLSPHPTDALLAALAQPAEPSIASADRGAPSSGRPVSPQYKNGWASRPSPLDTGLRPPDEWAPAPSYPYWRKQPNKPRPDLDPSAPKMQAPTDAPSRASKVQSGEAAAPGYVQDKPDLASLKADWKSTLSDKKKSKKAVLESEDDFESPAAKGNRRGKRGRKKDNRAMRQAMDSEDEDSLGEAAYDDYMANLIAQAEAEDEGEGDLFRFTGSANLGPSMVVDGKEIPDDELLPKSTKRADRDKVEDEEAGYAKDDDEWESDSSALNPDPDEVSSEEDLSLDSSDLEEDVEYSERQQWQDEEDIRQRRLDRLTDEQIARLLAKQEEFGIAGDEIPIEDQDAFPYTPEEGVGDIEAARAGLYDITNNSFMRPQRKRGNRKDHFPDASAFADTVEQYGERGFDIMDFERPSLRPIKKGRKGKMPPELDLISDEELQETLDNTWRKDRMKKAQKKLEREQLRREGLLGSAGRKGKADLNAKYPLGMTMVEVHHELREFLQNEDLYERSFPPLAKMQRKELHEIAVALNLNSRSQGGGKNRFPIVYKTSRTQAYSEDMFGRVMMASGKGFLTRGKAKKIAKGKVGGGGGGMSKNKLHVANGQIVGAGAAEIGHESMGHKLMMRMGWSKGQGLGKEGEGMKTPVEQKVRLGTAGLG